MLIKCPECGATVSDAATSCPRCGFPIAGTEKSFEAVPAADQIPPKLAEEVVWKDSKAPVLGTTAIIAAVLGTIHAFVIMAFFYNNHVIVSEPVSLFSSIFSNTAEVNMRLWFIGVALNWSGAIVKKNKIVLAAAIVYCFSACFWLLFIALMAPTIILAFVGARKLNPNRPYRRR